MNHDLAVRIYQQIQASALEDLRDIFIDSAVRYARMRVDWLRADSPKQYAMGGERTRCHDAFLSACQMLKRNMEGQGEECSWFDLLGRDRKDVGDFACYLHCLLGIAAR